MWYHLAILKGEHFKLVFRALTLFQCWHALKKKKNKGRNISFILGKKATKNPQTPTVFFLPDTFIVTMRRIKRGKLLGEREGFHTQL